MRDVAGRAKALAPPGHRAAIRSLWPILAGVAVAAAMQYASVQWVPPYFGKIVTDIGISIILAVSLNLVNGFTGQFSIGHAGFMAVGAYTAGAITYYGSFFLWGDAAFHGGIVSWTPPLAMPTAWLTGADLLFVAGCLAGGITAAAAGYIVGLPSLRLKGDYLAIVTLGFGEIMRVLLLQTRAVMDDVEQIRSASPGQLAASLGGSLGFSGLPYYTTIFWVYVAVAVMLIVAYRVKESTFGRAFLAIRENEIAAEAMGVPVTRYKVRSFVLAAFFAGIAGGLFAHEVGTSLRAEDMGFQKSFDVVIMVVLGGMGSISGVMLAAIVLTVMPEALRAFSEYRMVVYALLLIVMMILRPQGLFGVREIWEMGPFRRLLGGKTP